METSYILYKTDGTHELIPCEKPLSLERLQSFVGGMIEYAPEEPDGSIFCVNEEGYVDNLPENPFCMYRNQIVSGFMRGNIVHGRIDEEGEFVGFEDPEKYLRRKEGGIDPAFFEAGKVFTFIGVGEMMGITTSYEMKSTGEKTASGQPIFKKAASGSRSRFTSKHLGKRDVLIFEGRKSDLPFCTDTDRPSVDGRIMLIGNGKLNLCGNPEVIDDCIKTKNLNRMFDRWDLVNLIEVDGSQKALYNAPQHETREATFA